MDCYQQLNETPHEKVPDDKTLPGTDFRRALPSYLLTQFGH